MEEVIWNNRTPKTLNHNPNPSPHSGPVPNPNPIYNLNYMRQSLDIVYYWERYISFLTVSVYRTVNSKTVSKTAEEVGSNF